MNKEQLKNILRLNKDLVKASASKIRLPKTVGLVQHLGENAVKHGRYR